MAEMIRRIHLRDQQGFGAKTISAVVTVGKPSDLGSTTLLAESLTRHELGILVVTKELRFVIPITNLGLIDFMPAEKKTV